MQTRGFLTLEPNCRIFPMQNSTLMSLDKTSIAGVVDLLVHAADHPIPELRSDSCLQCCSDCRGKQYLVPENTTHKITLAEMPETGVRGLSCRYLLDQPMQCLAICSCAGTPRGRLAWCARKPLTRIAPPAAVPIPRGSTI